MIEWLFAHSRIINSATNIAMLLIWIGYLQVLVSSYHRQTRSKIMITRSGVDNLQSRCLVCNMSSEPIYLLSLMIELKTPDDLNSYPITEIEGFEKWDNPSDVDLWSRQGPLDPGKVRDMGSFKEMIAHALRYTKDTDMPDEADWPAIESLEIKVIASYGSENLPVGAKRRFDVKSDHQGWVLRPDAAVARQIRARGERKRLGTLLEEIRS
ncbi:hypothetical protein [Maritalea myrionectae]|uniref:Uncharacterized protein n=1 Tax=Maritalea myrionectae TaxID=454601 RepID=A0A2R4MGZ7_9HYPH|nr:hypothetical protein [Maritalea myrionectae]AVX05156.1 hypothetical protein MXMO3_02644 [Maritalea myrionectae]